MRPLDPRVKKILEFIRTYLEERKKAGWGSLMEFSRKCKVRQYTLSRILSGDPNYEPKMHTILAILEGIFGKSPLEFEGKPLLIDISPDMRDMSELTLKLIQETTKLDPDGVDLLLRFLDILNFKEIIDKKYFASLVGMVLLLHEELTRKRGCRDRS